MINVPRFPIVLTQVHSSGKGKGQEENIQVGGVRGKHKVLKKIPQAIFAKYNTFQWEWTDLENVFPDVQLLYNWIYMYILFYFRNL
jgi:hypothetical protein